MKEPSKTISRRGPRLNIWLSQDDKTKIEEKAKRANLSLTDYVLTAALERELPPPKADQVALPELYELQKIGLNLNQAVRWAHQRQAWAEEIEPLIHQIKHLLHVYQS